MITNKKSQELGNQLKNSSTSNQTNSPASTPTRGNMVTPGVRTNESEERDDPALITLTTLLPIQHATCKIMQMMTTQTINKKNDNFVQNENSEHDDFGFKWSLSAFCKHLETVGINMSLLWSRIFDVIIKTLACGEHYVLQAQKKN